MENCWYWIWMHILKGSIWCLLIYFYICISLGGVLDSFDKCFVIIKKREIVEPLFDFNDIKTLLLWFLIKLFSVSKMNLTLKEKASLNVLQLQHLVERFESLKIRIWILKTKIKAESNPRKRIRIHKEWIRIS